MREVPPMPKIKAPLRAIYLFSSKRCSAYGAPQLKAPQCTLGTIIVNEVK